MKSIIKIALVISIAFFGYASCKKGSSNKDKGQILEQKITNELPEELKNTTWLQLKGSTSSEILDYEKRFPESIIKFDDKKISLEMNEQGEYSSFEIDSILVNDKGFSIIKDGFFIGRIDFIWVNKSKGIADWSITYNNYSGQGVEVHKSRRIQKSFVTSENFQEPKIKEKTSKVENVSSNKLGIYGELVDNLPIEGRFSCKYKEDGNVYSGAYLKISNRDYEVENLSDNTIKIHKNDIKIKVNDVLYLQCDVRKVKSSSNKYALFYKTFYTKYDPPEQSQYYSKTRPIAEIEILDDNTIKKKWLGVYNNRTKKIESIDGYFDWDDEYCDIIKRIN